MENPYLDAITIPHEYLDSDLNMIPSAEIGPSDMEGIVEHQRTAMLERHQLLPKFAYAIPNQRAIDRLVSLSPVIDVGAGLGYWSWLIERQGGFSRAIDPHPSDEIDPTFDRTQTRHEPWGVGFQTARQQYPAFTEVHKADHTILEHYDNHTLLLSWPDYDEQWAEEALDCYGGDTLVYIGEGEGGCTATPAFHKRLTKEWEWIETIDIPSWPYVHDSMGIYNRT